MRTAWARDHGSSSSPPGPRRGVFSPDFPTGEPERKRKRQEEVMNNRYHLEDNEVPAGKYCDFLPREAIGSAKTARGQVFLQARMLTRD